MATIGDHIQWGSGFYNVLHPDAAGGADPLGVRDSTAAFQAASDIAPFGSTVIIPRGMFRLNGWRPKDFLFYHGVGGWQGSQLVAFGPDGIANFPALNDAHFRGLTFRASAKGGRAFYQTDLTRYTENCSWDRCHFRKELEECLYLNMILCTVSRSSFGYYGSSTVGAYHRHIWSQGHATNGNHCNHNELYRNRFNSARNVDEALRFERGMMLYLTLNDFETNLTRPLTCYGMAGVHFRQNWFEANRPRVDEYELVFTTDSTGTVGNYIITFDENYFGPHDNVRALIGVGNASQVSRFVGNNGSFRNGQKIINLPDRLDEYHSNRFAGTVTEEPTQRRGSIFGPIWGSPEGLVTAPAGSLCTSRGGSPYFLYSKTTDSGATGWVGK